MNKIENALLLYLYKNGLLSQRELAKKLGCSLGMVNKSLNRLKQDHLLNEDCSISPVGKQQIEKNQPENAIILAAGLGMRMTPINQDVSKGLLIVKKKAVIEHTIECLKAKRIDNIYIVVGYMKEQYEYLIDKYHVHLIVNNRYDETNNSYSLYLARKYLHNSYIIPCDIYLGQNPFHESEYQSWYLFNQNIRVKNNYKITKTGFVELSKKEDIRDLPLGIAYVNETDSQILKAALDHMDSNTFEYRHYYWENAAFENHVRFISAYANQCDEINTYEDLRDLDITSPSLKSNIIDIITASLAIDMTQIKNITLSKKGMTNRSFLFETEKGKYIMRIPGEGTDQLINRHEEGMVYQVLEKYDIADEVVYFNQENGYKLTKFIPESRVCDANNEDDIRKCMTLLKSFHQLNLKVDHYFDIYEKIAFYEKLRGNRPSLYSDYEKTREKVYALKKIIDKMPKHECLTHIDAVPDNFLIYRQGNEEKIKLIDWEYASMQDSDVDIAMFCIYALYDKKQCDHLMDIYYDHQCDDTIRLKIYCYIAACGFLWSNWCEYKHALGVEFGEYSLAQYRYAKDFYRYAHEFMEENQICIK